MSVSVVRALYILCSLVVLSTDAVPMSRQTNLISFCDTEGILTSKDIALIEGGNAPSKTISLSPETFAAVCKLRVTSPNNHVISMQFVESTVNLHRSLMFNNTERHPPCTMSIYLPDDSTRPFWEGDPCSQEPLPDVDLLTSEFEVVWAPPPNPNHTKGRTFIITAIGNGRICKEPGQHTCMRIGRQPVFCVSEKLLCDGIQHCPKSVTRSDEAEEICNGNEQNPATWEQLAQEFAVKILKKFKTQPEEQQSTKLSWTKPKYDFNLRDGRKGIKENSWQEWKRITKVTTPKPPPVVHEEKPKPADSLSTMLSKYGPWGYLMMGLLICGTVLMFCGLWECCIRKPKTEADPTISTQPTAILISNQGEAGTVISPPNYDDLDEPPSYNTLFPNLKNNSVSCGCASMQDESGMNVSGTSTYYSTCAGCSSMRRSSNVEVHVAQINRIDESQGSSTSTDSISEITTESSNHVLEQT